jgi:hypothetical protein
MIASRNSQRIMESEMILRTGIVLLLVSLSLIGSQEVQAQGKKKKQQNERGFQLGQQAIKSVRELAY